MSATQVTAAEVMDRSAVLMNDPSKTDYTYAVLAPFLKMALDELAESLIDGQQAGILRTSSPIVIPIGTIAIYPPDSLNTPRYPADLVEIQEVKERLAGSNDSFFDMKKEEFLDNMEAGDRLHKWQWAAQVINFNPNGAKTVREVQLNYLASFSELATVPTDAVLGPANSRSFLSYKTAAYAAMFIGENPIRAQTLDSKAEAALERMESINNKGRQQIMTRHRPFRAAYKMRGGF